MEEFITVWLQIMLVVRNHQTSILLSMVNNLWLMIFIFQQFQRWASALLFSILYFLFISLMFFWRISQLEGKSWKNYWDHLPGCVCLVSITKKTDIRICEVWGDFIKIFMFQSDCSETDVDFSFDFSLLNYLTVLWRVGQEQRRQIQLFNRSR